MAESLKQQTFKGIGWSAIERFSVQGVTFVIQIILARLLTPSDYGVIGMLAIFLQISQVFIDCGFANALIQKQNCDEKDYSTVFWYNLGIAVIIYWLLYAFAPLISNFYNVEILSPVLRIISITLILNAISIVQRTKLVKAVDFKSQSKVTLSSSIISGGVGIFLAYLGCGVWALVIQQILNSFFQTLFFVVIVKWYPRLILSKDSFMFVFNFGSKLLVARLINVVYKNLYTIVIGKKFSSLELGLYTRAETFALFPSNNIGNIISRVSYPIFSKIQDQDEKLKSAYRKMIRFSSLFIFPLMIGLLSVARPFILSVLTEKWSQAIIILQILCIDWMLDHLSLLNLNLLYVKKRTDLVLRLEVIKKTIAIIILFVSIPYGLIIMCWGRVLYSIIATIINTYYTNKLIGLSFFQQMQDIIPYIIASVLMGVCVYIVGSFMNNYYAQLCFGILSGITVYSVESFIFFRKDVKELISMFISVIKKKW